MNPFPRRCSTFSRFLLGCVLAAGATCATVGPVRADADVVADRYFDMSVLPDNVPASPWERVGSAPAFLLPDQSLIINDNSVAENIAFQTLLGQIEADHSVALTARVKVLSNLDGHAVTMEIARPGLEAVLRLFPDRADLVERERDGSYRWLATFPVDLEEYHTITLRKESRVEDAAETVSVLVDDQVVMQTKPRCAGGLGIGRLLIGSLTYGGVGASLWDWVSYRLVAVSGELPAASISVGALKTGYAGH